MMKCTILFPCFVAALIFSGCHEAKSDPLLSHLMEGDSYGYQINKDILEKTDSRYELKEATLYTAFRRLEQAGYITAYWGNQKTGARRRYYSITPEGRAAYCGYKRDWEEAKELIDKLLR